MTIPTLEHGGTERTTTGGMMEEGPGIGSGDTVVGASTSQLKVEVGGAEGEVQEIMRTGRTESQLEWSWSVVGELNLLHIFCHRIQLTAFSTI